MQRHASLEKLENNCISINLSKSGYIAATATGWYHWQSKRKEAASLHWERKRYWPGLGSCSHSSAALGSRHFFSHYGRRATSRTCSAHLNDWDIVPRRRVAASECGIPALSVAGPGASGRVESSVAGAVAAVLSVQGEEENSLEMPPAWEEKILPLSNREAIATCSGGEKQHHQHGHSYHPCGCSPQYNHHFDRKPPTYI